MQKLYRRASSGNPMLFTCEDMAVSTFIGPGIVKRMFTTQTFYFDKVAAASGTELGGTRPPSSDVVAAERCSVATAVVRSQSIALCSLGLKVICL